VHNVRRYTAKGLGRLLEAGGFRVVCVTYWNTVLFPLMIIIRKVLPKRGGVTSDVTEYPRAIDSLCRVATTFETALLKRGLRLPFGGSVIAIATKNSTAGG